MAKTNPQNGGIRHTLNMDRLIDTPQPLKVTKAVKNALKGKVQEGKPTEFGVDPRHLMHAHLRKNP